MMYESSKSDPPPYDTAEYENGPPKSYYGSAEEVGGSYSQTQTTTTSTTTTTSSSGIGFQRGFIATKRGILKIVEIVLSIVCMICASLMYGGAAGWGWFTSASAFFFCLIWFLLYLFNVNSVFHPVMPLVELIYHSIWTLFYLIAGLVAVSVYANYPSPAPWGAFAFFAFLAVIPFAIDSVIHFRHYRATAANRRSQQTTTFTETHTEVRY